MHSPVDPKATLQRADLTDGLIGWMCPSSGGWWIDGDVYWTWLRSQPEMPLGITPPDGVEIQTADSTRALISPRSGRLMQKFEVGGSLSFLVDFDKTSGGFWLDAGEVEHLTDQGLIDRLHLICDAGYQRRLRELDTQAAKTERLAELLGADGKTRIEAVAEWLSGHEHEELGVAYLLELLDRD